MSTRKDFEMVAEILSKARKHNVSLLDADIISTDAYVERGLMIQRIQSMFIAEFSDSNPRFNVERFRDAAKA